MRFRNKTKSPKQSGSFPVLDDDGDINEDDKIASLSKHSPAATKTMSSSFVAASAAVDVLKTKQAKNRNRNRIRGSFLNKLNQLKCSSRADPADHMHSFSDYYGRRAQKMDDNDYDVHGDYIQGPSENFKWIEEPLPILEAPLVEFDTEELDDDSDYSRGSHLDRNDDDDSDGTSTCSRLFEDSILSSDNDDHNDRQIIGIQPFCVTQHVEEQMRERERAAAAAATTDDTAVRTNDREDFYLDGEKTIFMGASDVEESLRDKPDDGSRPRPRPCSLSSKVIIAPVVPVFSPTGAVLKKTLYVEEQQAVSEETSPNRGRVTFRAQTAGVLQETRRSSTNFASVPIVDGPEDQEQSHIPDASLSPSLDSSYNSKMHDLSFGLSMESMDMNDFSSDSSYDSEIDDIGEPSIEEEDDDDDDSLSAFLAAASPLRSDEKTKSDQTQEELRKDENKSSQPISRPSIDSLDSLGEQKSDKADYNWQALRNNEKQRLDLDTNQFHKKRLDFGNNQDGVEWRKPPPHSPIYSARLSHTNARTGVLEFGSTQEKLKLTKSPGASSRMQELIGRFEQSTSPRIQELIGRFERPEPKPTLEIPRRERRNGRENRQDVGDRVNSISSSFSSSVDVSDFPARHPTTSSAPHTFFWRSHPRVESLESKTVKLMVSTVALVKVDPQLVDTSRSADADSERYAGSVDSSFDCKNMADHQPVSSIRESVSSERIFL